MGGGGTASPAFEYCSNQSVSYTQRIDNPDGWNWCLVPDGGFDAVFFAGMAITVMCMASPRWDALISLLAGGVYEILVYYFNLGHVSNAVNLWLGMRPADIFVFVFLPPFLLDLAVRIDFFKLKKMIVNVLFMAFVMVISTCLLLVPFMLYGLDLAASGWTATYVALFGAAIASTDAAAVCAVLNAGGAPEVLSVLLEGESLFNDASSLTLFEIFKELVQESSAESLSEEIAHIVVKTITSALIGVAVGMAIGIFNRLLFIWLQWRNMPSFAEVAFSVAGAYLSFYITQVWCHGSGCVGAVAYGLYGSATLLWGISSKTRQSQQFQHFWAVLTFIVNALIFYYVGASCVNFTIRASNNLYTEGGSAELLRVALYKLPIIWAFVFVLRFAFMLPTFYGLRLLKVGGEASWQQVLFLSVGGLRGSLSLVLAQTIATLTKTSAQSSEEERREDRVKAEAAMYTAGFVIMTLVVNAPLCGPLMTLLGLSRISEEQQQMRAHVKSMFYKFTAKTVQEMQEGQEDDEMLQGVDWDAVAGHLDFKDQLDKQLPEAQPRVAWGSWLDCSSWRVYWQRLRRRGRRGHALEGLADEGGSGQGSDVGSSGPPGSDKAKAGQGLGAAPPPPASNSQSLVKVSLPLGLGLGRTSLPDTDRAERLRLREELRQAGLQLQQQGGAAGQGLGGGQGPGGEGGEARLSTMQPGILLIHDTRTGPSATELQPPPNLLTRRSAYPAAKGPRPKPMKSAVPDPAAAVPLKPGEPPHPTPPGTASFMPAWLHKRRVTAEARVAGEVAGGVGADEVRLDVKPFSPPTQVSPPRLQQPSLQLTRQSSRNIGVLVASLDPPRTASQQLRQSSSSPPPPSPPPLNDTQPALVQATQPSTAPPPPLIPLPPALRPASPPPADPMQAKAASPPRPTSPSSDPFAIAMLRSLLDRSTKGHQDTNDSREDPDAARARDLAPRDSGPPAHHLLAGVDDAGQPPVSPTRRRMLAAAAAVNSASAAAKTALSSAAAVAATKLSTASNAAADALSSAMASVSPQLASRLPAAWTQRSEADAAPPDPQPRPPPLPELQLMVDTAHHADSTGTAMAPNSSPSSGLGANAVAPGPPTLPAPASPALPAPAPDSPAPGPAPAGPAPPSASLDSLQTARRQVFLARLSSQLLGQPALPGPKGQGLSTAPEGVKEGEEEEEGEEALLPDVSSLRRCSIGAAADALAAQERAALAGLRGAAPSTTHHLNGQQGGGHNPRLVIQPSASRLRGAGVGPPQPGAAQGGVGGGVGQGGGPRFSLLKQAMANNAAGGGGTGVMVQRQMADGSLATTSMLTRPLGRGSVSTTAPLGPAAAPPAASSALDRGSRGQGGAAQGLDTTSTAPGWLHPQPSRELEGVGLRAGEATCFSEDAPPSSYRRPAHQRSASLHATALPPLSAYSTSLAALHPPHTRAAAATAAAPRPGSALGGAGKPGAVAGGAAGGAAGGKTLSGRSIGGALGRGSAAQRFFNNAEEEGGGSAHEADPSPGALLPGGKQAASRMRSDLATASRSLARDTSALGRSSRPLTLLARLSADSATVPGLVPAGGADRASVTAHHMMLVEYRLRLLTGLQGYFRERYAESILSPQAYQTLSFICSQAHHHPQQPLDLWGLARAEVSSSRLLQAEAHCYYQLKKWVGSCRRSTNWVAHQVLARMLLLPVALLSAHLSRVTLAGLETAVELWMSLSSSLQTQWLEFSGPYGALVLQEVERNAEGAWAYIVDRRIEAPEKFQAIQTYRATVQVLSQQLAFVHEMSHGGMIEEGEEERMKDVIQRRLQAVSRSGPQWRRQSVAQILSAVPFLRGASPQLLAWVRKHSRMQVYATGECLWEFWGGDARLPGMFIVLSGVVRCMLFMEDSLQPVYLGCGGVGGLASMVLGESVAGVGMRAAYAEGNALGKGPVVMHIPWEVFGVIRQLSRVEHLPTWQQLELAICRAAATHVLDLLRNRVQEQLALFVCGALAGVVGAERADSKLHRRQRIRALLKEPALGFEGEAGVGLGGVDWVAELLELPPLAAQQLLDGSLDAALAKQAWHSAMFQAVAATTGAVYDQIKNAVKDSMLVVLGPGQAVWQTSTMVLIQGSLAGADEDIPAHTPPPASGGLTDADRVLGRLDEAAAVEERDSTPHPGPSPGAVDLNGHAAARTTGAFVASSNEDHVAPSMLVWTADYFDVEVPVQPPVRIQAGSKGATLLVWGVEAKDLLGAQ